MTDQLLADVAAILAEVAAAEVMPRWRNLASTDVAEKTGPDDIVTVADEAAEKALTRRLERLLPGSTTVGEEAVAADAGVMRRLAQPGHVWVIDPIDGTSAFAAGEPDFTLMVALVEDGITRAGWIFAPALGRMTFGASGSGAYEAHAATAPSRLSPPAAPGDLTGLVGLLGKRNLTPERRALLKAKEPHFKALDGVTYAGIDYVKLMRGEAHFAVYNKSEPWDHLPGLAIVEALGFAWSKFDGTPYRPGDNTGGLLVAPDAPRLTAIRDILFRT